VSYPGRSAYLHFREARDGASALASKASSSAHLASAACEKDDAPVHAMHRNGVRWQPADPAGAHELLEPPSRALLHRRSGEERRPSEARRTITSGLSGVPRTCRTRRDQLRPQGKRTRPGGAATSLGGLLNIRCVTTSLASTCTGRTLRGKKRGRPPAIYGEVSFSAGRRARPEDRQGGCPGARQVPKAALTSPIPLARDREHG
jgi:hypothetical protein